MRLVHATTRRFDSSKDPLCDERGVSILEFAIILPLLVLLFFGLFELGLALNTYLTLAQITREGVRYASHTPNLQSGQYERSTCSGTCGRHKSVHDMLDKIIERHQLSNRFENHQDLEITTDLDLSGSGVVTVSLRGPYRGWLLLKGFDIATLDKGPYLYR